MGRNYLHPANVICALRFVSVWGCAAFRDSSSTHVPPVTLSCSLSSTSLSESATMSSFELDFVRAVIRDTLPASARAKFKAVWDKGVINLHLLEPGDCAELVTLIGR